MNKYRQSERIENEIKHFSDLEHIWWGAKTVAGQRRYDNKLSEMVKKLQIKKGAKILEIGCGDGEFTKRLVSIDAKITAIDITPLVVERGRKTIKNKNVRFLVDDAETMSFPSNTFDIVCGISILHHVNIQKALQEAFRILKKGGQIFFTEPNLLNPHTYAGLHIEFIRKRMEFSPDENALVRWKVNSILKIIGFREHQVRNYDFLHPKTPKSWIKAVENLSKILERTPLIKEISGSLIIWAKK